MSTVRARMPQAIASPFEATAESARRPIVPGLATRTVHLYPGHVLTPSEPTVVTTILGSCVAVCLWDHARAAGGMNHFLLPDAPIGDRFSGRFAEVACARLLEAMIGGGSDRRDLVAKVFGGACVIDALHDGATHLGARNVDAARAFLDRERIALVAQDVLGRHGRKVMYATDTGDVWVRTIKRGGH